MILHSTVISIMKVYTVTKSINSSILILVLMFLLYSTIKVEYKIYIVSRILKYVPKFMDIRFSLIFQWDTQISDVLCYFQYVNF